MTAPSGNIVKKHDPKDSWDIKDYAFKYGTYWLTGGDTIATSEWLIYNAATDELDANLVVDSDTMVEDSNKTARVWLSGGVAGQTYKVVNRITTAGGRRQEVAFLLPVV